MDGQLLYRGYQFSDDLALDLYGYAPDADSDSYEVTTATLAGDSRNLADLLTRSHLQTMSDWLDRHMERGTLEVLAERAEHDSMMRRLGMWRQA
jgi:hypothetical protein